MLESLMSTMVAWEFGGGWVMAWQWFMQILYHIYIKKMI